MAVIDETTEYPQVDEELTESPAVLEQQMKESGMVDPFRTYEKTDEIQSSEPENALKSEKTQETQEIQELESEKTEKPEELPRETPFALSTTTYAPENAEPIENHEAVLAPEKVQQGVKTLHNVEATRIFPTSTSTSLHIVTAQTTEYTQNAQTTTLGRVFV